MVDNLLDRIERGVVMVVFGGMNDFLVLLLDLDL